jgi:hypothetical protein
MFCGTLSENHCSMLQYNISQTGFRENPKVPRVGLGGGGGGGFRNKKCLMAEEFDWRSNIATRINIHVGMLDTTHTVTPDTCAWNLL